MTCNYVRSRRMRRSNIMEEGGFPESAQMVRERAALPPAHPDYREDKIVGGDSFFMCGDMKLLTCKLCNTVADYLCDYPVGKGHTCDLPLCEEHRSHVGEDFDLCPIHAAEHEPKAQRPITVGQPLRLVQT